MFNIKLSSDGVDAYFLDDDNKTCVLIEEECIFIEDEGCSFCDDCYLPEECDKFDNGNDFLEWYKQEKRQ
jgi:hypothetical protein